MFEQFKQNGIAADLTRVQEFMPKIASRHGVSMHDYMRFGTARTDAV